MANLTSSQSGNWSSSTTWGGSTPADGDTFTISQGHKVTVNSDQRAGTGFGDISVRGNLHFATNGKIRINGRITVQGNGSTDYSKTNGVSAQDFTEGNSSSGALLSATGENIRIEFEGTNSDQHGIWIENISYSSWKFDGNDNVLLTTLNANTDIEDSYLSVTSSNNFKEGDWVSVYCNDHQDYRVISDESFWVHDTAANKIYLRKFVGPRATISSASGSSLVVDEKKIFRVGYKLIFGSGSTLNVRTITALNHLTKTITLNASINNAGSISSGTYVYETGADKKHLSGHKVRRNAATVSTAAAVNDTTITISDASDLSVGEFINIDVNNDTDTNWDYNTAYEITSKSGNTLTVSPAIGNIRKVGSLVQKLTRPIQIYGMDEDVRAFCLVEYDTDYNRASTREILLKNVEWKNMGGNTNSTWYRASVFVGGYNSRYRDNEYTSNSRQDFQSRYENSVVWDGNNKGQSYTGMNTRHTYGFVHRNCLSIDNGTYQYWHWSSHHDVQFVGNYGTRSRHSCYYGDALYEPYNEIAYNYMSRSDDYGYLFHHNRENNPIKYNIAINHEQRPFYQYYSPPGQEFRRWYIEGFRTMPYNGVGSGDIKFVDSYIVPKWRGGSDTHATVRSDLAELQTSGYGAVDGNDLWGNGGPEGRSSWDRGAGQWQNIQYLNHNFYEGLEGLSEGGHFAYRKNGANMWTVLNGQVEYYPVLKQVIYVPCNTAVTIKGEFKGQSSGSWSYPYLVAYPINNSVFGRFQTGYTDQTSNLSSSDTSVVKSVSNSFRQTVRFDSAIGVWQEKSLSIAAQKYDYQLVTFYAPDADQQEELAYFKNIIVEFTGAKPKTKVAGGRGKIKGTVSRKRISGRI